MKKVSILVLCAMLLALLTACGHTHTYSDKWTNDATNHWHAANCEHTGEKADEAAHVDANNDVVCDVCGYDYGHTHTYGDTWSMDEANHWYASACGHESMTKDKAAHVDANNDKACDVCAYDYGHTHTYQAEGEWTHDATNHWHAATCGCSIDGIDVAAHADENNDGVCDGCAWNYDHEHTYAEEWSTDRAEHWLAVTCGHTVADKDRGAHVDADGDFVCDTCDRDFMADFEFAMSEDASALVNGHTVLYKDAYDNETTTVVVFGKNFTKLVANDIETWLTKAGDGYFTVQIIDGEISAYAPYTALENGWECDGEFLGYAEGIPANGLEALLYNIIVFGEEYANNGMTLVYDLATDTYTVSYRYFSGSVYDLVVTVKLSDANTIASLQIDSTRYFSFDEDPWTVDENGIVTLNPDAEPYGVYSITATQTTGERTGESEYTAEKLVPTSFDLVNADGSALADVIKVTAGTPVYLHFANVKADGAKLSLDNVNAESSADGLTAYYSDYDWMNDIALDRLQLSGSVAGTYTLTITTTNVTKTVTVLVEMPAPTEISASVKKTEDYGGGYISTYFEKMNEVTIYLGQSVEFTAEVNEFADGTYTVSGGIFTDSSYDDGWNPTVLTKVFTPDAVGTYEIVLTSAVDASLTTTLTVIVKEIPSIEMILGGKYEYTDWNGAGYVVIFDGNTITINATVIDGYDEYWSPILVEVSATYTFTYSETDGIVLTPVSGDYETIGASLALSDNYGLKITVPGNWGDETYELVQTEAPVIGGEEEEETYVELKDFAVLDREHVIATADGMIAKILFEASAEDNKTGTCTVYFTHPRFGAMVDAYTFTYDKGELFLVPVNGMPVIMGGVSVVITEGELDFAIIMGVEFYFTGEEPAVEPGINDVTVLDRTHIVTSADNVAATIVFEASEEDPASGKCTVYFTHPRFGAMVDEYTFTCANGELSLIPVNGMPVIMGGVSVVITEGELDFVIIMGAEFDFNVEEL